MSQRFQGPSTLSYSSRLALLLVSRGPLPFQAPMQVTFRSSSGTSCYRPLLQWGKPPQKNPGVCSHISFPRVMGYARSWPGPWTSFEDCMNSPRSHHHQAVWVKNRSTDVKTGQETPLSGPRPLEENNDRCSKRLGWETAGFLRNYGNKSRHLPLPRFPQPINSHLALPTEANTDEQEPSILNMSTRMQQEPGT